MSASTAMTFNACTKPKTIRCASLSDRAPRAQSAPKLIGASFGGIFSYNQRPSHPAFKTKELKGLDSLGLTSGSPSERAEPGVSIRHQSPETLPVFGFTRCTRAHARHVTWT